jgi:ribonuclease HI
MNNNPIMIYCVGYRTTESASYGVVLLMGDCKYASSGKLEDGLTKNQSDLVSVIMAMRCIKPDYYNHPIILHVPAGYVSNVLKRVGGEWQSSIKANIKIVTDVRSTISQFSNVTIKSVSPTDPEFRECLRSAKCKLNN